MMHPRSPSSSGSSVDHPGRRMGDAAKGADQVDRDRQLELLHRVEFDRPGLLVAADRLGGIGDAGAIDQHALLAMRLARLGEGRRDFFVAGHVDFAEDAADLASDLLALVGVAVEHRDLGSAPRQLPRRRFAKPRRGAGDHRRNSVMSILPSRIAPIVPAQVRGVPMRSSGDHQVHKQF